MSHSSFHWGNGREGGGSGEVFFSVGVVVGQWGGEGWGWGGGGVSVLRVWWVGWLSMCRYCSSVSVTKSLAV